MRKLMATGAILVVLGVIGLAIPYFTTSQTKDIARVGDIKLQTTESTRTPSRRWRPAPWSFSAACCSQRASSRRLTHRHVALLNSQTGAWAARFDGLAGALGSKSRGSLR